MRAVEAVKRDLVERWLEKAEQDFGAAEQLLRSGSPYPFVIAFHSQQAKTVERVPHAASSRIPEDPQHR